MTLERLQQCIPITIDTRQLPYPSRLAMTELLIMLSVGVIPIPQHLVLCAYIIDVGFISSWQWSTVTVWDVDMAARMDLQPYPGRLVPALDFWLQTGLYPLILRFKA
jgi:hypothetical protein